MTQAIACAGNIVGEGRQVNALGAGKVMGELNSMGGKPEKAPPRPIPVVETGAGFPLATLVAEEARAHALLDQATRYVPNLALRCADAISRRWLAKSNNSHLEEIDAIAARLKRP